MKKIFFIIFGVLIIFLGALFVAVATVSKENTSEKFLYKIIPINTSTLGIKEKPETRENKIKILMVGDVMLDRNVWRKTKEVGKGDYNFPFQKLNDEFVGYDFRLANLEGPITDNRSVVSPANLQFTFSPLYLDPLKSKFEILGLANNHTNNFGQKGLKQTREYLFAKQIIYFGSPYNEKNELSTIIEKNGIKIGLVGYHQLIGYGLEDVLLEIKKLKSSVDYLIVFPHWGIEYSSQEPGAKQKKEAKLLVDAGADLIIGTHPHVIQPIEKYNGKYIFYSLGNFIFDQYFSSETMQGLGVSLELSKKENNENIFYKINLLPFQINKDYQPDYVEDEKQKVLDFLSIYSWVDEVDKLKIKQGKL